MVRSSRPLDQMSIWKITARLFIHRHRRNRLAAAKRTVYGSRFTHTNSPLIKCTHLPRPHLHESFCHCCLYSSLFFSGSLTQNQIQSPPLHHVPQPDHTQVKTLFQPTPPMPQNPPTQQSAINTQFDQLYGNTSSMQSNNIRSNA